MSHFGEASGMECVGGRGRGREKGGEFVHEDRWTDRQTGRETDEEKDIEIDSNRIEGQADRMDVWGEWG